MQNTATIKGVDAATVRTWLDRGEAVLVDIREDREVAQECIPRGPSGRALGFRSRSPAGP